MTKDVSLNLGSAPVKQDGDKKEQHRAWLTRWLPSPLSTRLEEAGRLVVILGLLESMLPLLPTDADCKHRCSHGDSLILVDDIEASAGVAEIKSALEHLIIKRSTNNDALRVTMSALARRTVPLMSLN